jgi:DNA-binding NarL/FixJ family response regulator
VAVCGIDDRVAALVAARRVGVVVFACCPAEDQALAALARLKEQQPRVSALLVTPAPTPQGLLRAVGLGCSGYLPLGVTGDALVHAIRQMAAGECAFESGVLRQLIERVGRSALKRAQEAGTLLTAPEREVLGLIVDGLTNSQIGDRLRWRLGTVKDYVQRVIEKLEVSDRTQAAVKAVRLGLVH